MDITCIIFGILFFAFGVAFALGKIHVRMPAWKNMPPEEKERINIVPLCRNIGEVIMLSGLIFFLKGVWTAFHRNWFVPAIIAWLVVAGFDVWHISKSERYQIK